jgi:predicted NAD-dependent protein-ADP-ribosyltransferase YbiA (DUF1768 family)
VVKGFTEQYKFLSSYFHFPFKYNGIEYNNVVCAFVAQSLSSDVQRKTVGKMLPAQAIATVKKYTTKEFSVEEQLDLMKEICRAKFSDKELKEKLLATEGELINETTWGNTFWGTNNDEGENHLGKILQELREEFASNNSNNSSNSKKKNKKDKKESQKPIEEIERDFKDVDYEGNADA